MDQEIKIVLNKVRKKIEGPKRNIPFSEEKVRRESAMKYWKSAIRKAKWKAIDKYRLENLEIYIENSNIELIEDMEQKLEITRKEIKELTEMGREIREIEILDYQIEDLSNETDKEKVNH